VRVLTAIFSTSTSMKALSIRVQILMGSITENVSLFKCLSSFLFVHFFYLMTTCGIVTLMESEFCTIPEDSGNFTVTLHFGYTLQD
jgi:hypothetical protein